MSATLRQVRDVARSMDCRVDYTFTRETSHHAVTVDAPVGMRFAASQCHFLGGGEWWGVQGDGREVFASILTDLREGLAPCDEPDCETCEERKAVRP